jgi:hypothetical protein
VTRLGQKIRIAPLEAGRVARIEDQVVAARGEAMRSRARGERRLNWRLGAAAAGLAAAVAIAVIAPGRGREEGARLEIGGAAVELAPGTQVGARTRADGAVVLDLARGRVDCEVEPRPHRAPFAVQAGDVAVEVVGTIFSVEREEGDVRVRVTRGVVRVAAVGRPAVRVAAGESWARSDAPATAVAHAGPASGDRGAPATAVAHAAPASGDRSATTGGRELAAGPGRGGAGSPASGGGAGADLRDRSSQAPALSPESGGEGPQPSPATGPERGGGRDGASRSSAAGPAPQGWPPRACDDVASCEAIALHETGPEAGRALYSLIYLQVFAGGDAHQAITLADLYERRFARRRAGEAEAVLWLRVLAHRKAGESQRARDAAARYLEHHPRGRFRAEAGRLLGDGE